MDDTDLFAGFTALVEAPQVVTSSATSSTEREVSAGWRLWSDLTERPDRSSINRDFAKAYRDLLRKNYKSTRLNEIIRGASRLPVVGRDAHDVRRVISSLTNANRTRVALAALYEMREIVLYPREEIVQRCSLRELEDALGTTSREWLEVDQEAAGLLMERYDADEMVAIAEHTALALGLDDMLPTEALRCAKTVGTLKVASRGDRDNYDAGKHESEILRGVSFAADPAAQRLLQRGERAERVRDFHLQAPTGYWDAVLDLMEEDISLSAEEVYNQISNEFDWHPADRG